jgi:cyclopropane fatty-acyl-phospholipid synthase-like methyltransferase
MVGIFCKAKNGHYLLIEKHIANLKNDLNIVHTEFFGGQHYARTLRHWRENMMKNKEYIMKWYSKKILDTYEYYFASCEAAFTSGVTEKRTIE